jgi:hypothetical protein
MQEKVEIPGNRVLTILDKNAQKWPFLYLLRRMPTQPRLYDIVRSNFSR